MKRVLYTAAAIILGTASVIPAHALAQTSVNIIVRDAPPPPRYEAVPAPHRGYIWSPGYWNWNGRRYVWAPGHWERVRAGYSYQRPQWQRTNNGWQLNRGGWLHGERANGYRHGDRDGDGIPNRMDSRPNNPYRH